MNDKTHRTPVRSLHRIDLTLPNVENDSTHLFCTIPSNNHLFSRTKTQIDLKSKSTARIRSPARLRHLMGPSQVNVFLDVPSSTTFQSSRKSRIQSSKDHHRTTTGVKDDGDRSQSSSIDRLLYESIGSFDDQYSFKTKTPSWKSIHHSQLTSTKVLHARRSTTLEHPGKINDQILFDNHSQESITSNNERLYDQIEQLTHSYFPTIRQIRHRRPIPELPAIHRMYLHREETNRFMPNLSRTRVVK